MVPLITKSRDHKCMASKVPEIMDGVNPRRSKNMQSVF